MCDDKGLISKAAVLALGDDDAEDLKHSAVCGSKLAASRSARSGK